jgi:hypothetical protein
VPLQQQNVVLGADWQLLQAAATTTAAAVAAAAAAAATAAAAGACKARRSRKRPERKGCCCHNSSMGLCSSKNCSCVKAGMDCGPDCLCSAASCSDACCNKGRVEG